MLLKHLRIRGIQVVLVTFLIISYSIFPISNKSNVAHAATTNSILTYDQLQPLLENAAINNQNYENYLSKYQGAAFPEQTISIPAVNYSAVKGMTVKNDQNFNGMSGASIETGESGSIEWKVQVNQSGFYNIGVQYYPIKGKDSAIQRGLLIDNQLPFKEAGTIDLPRVWGNASNKVTQDNQGNDLPPDQVEKPIWQNETLKDDTGLYSEPYSFYFTKGTHTITFVSIKEPVAIHSLELFQSPKVQSYSQVSKQYEQDGIRSTQGVYVKVQGEDAVYKSDPTLFPTYDRSSPSLEPYSPDKEKINVIGGNNWQIPGQWLEWKVTVPKDGLYKVALKTKQDFVRGVNSTRWLTIDGKTPFAEAKDLSFPFSTNWMMSTLGGNNSPYLFHLTKGTHTIRLTVSLGQLSTILVKVQDSMLQLNNIYRQIVMITGATPDPYRDYQLDTQIPNLISELNDQHAKLESVIKVLNQIAGGHSTQIAELSTMADQLTDMVNHPDNIADQLTGFDNNVAAIGNWMQTVEEQALSIDYLVVASPNQKLPSAQAGFFENMWNGVLKLVDSFIIDYNAVGNISTAKTTKTITVWTGSGRDQAQILKSMIDQDFTPKTGIKVNLRLVNIGQQLLPATLAGSGPDVAMQGPSDTMPVDFALRNAAYNLKNFSDYNQVASRFRKSAMVPYEFQNGDYALPETQTFPMLYYRKDIFHQMGWKVPQTWQDVYNLIPELEKHHMEFGMPLPVQQFAWVPLDPNPVFSMLLFQNGGSFYNANDTKTGLDSRTAQNVFKSWTQLYTDYGLPAQFNFANRFRSGLMPIGIDYYTTYNQLQIFAPEIKGLWGFVPVPGTIKQDGTIDRSAASIGNSAMILQKSKDKDASWQFLKWWTSTSVQTQFGLRMEGLMGPAGRYPTANIKAFANLPWPKNEYDELSEQFKSVKGVPQVPGGYFTGRNLNNAFYSVINHGTEPRETINQYSQQINDEITLRRQQFGLPTK